VDHFSLADRLQSARVIEPAFAHLLCIFNQSRSASQGSLSESLEGSDGCRRAHSHLKRRARFQEMVRCLGQTREGMIVYYTPDPGFRGYDSFVLEVSYPGHPADLDTFTVIVQ
jgi:hypothetical protein